MSPGASGELVSVIVPAFNAAAYLGQTLDQIRRQSHERIEVIVVDDGSSDATATIAQGFVERDRRFRLLRQSNHGVAHARNRAIEAARGRFIAPCDGDDLWTENKLEAQLASWLEAGPRTGLVYCWSRVIDGAGRTLRYECPQTIEGDAFARMCRGNLVGNGSAALMLREAVLACGGYDPSLQARGLQGCEDLKLYTAIAERYAFAVTRQYCVGYRHTPDNMSGNWRRMLGSYDHVSAERIQTHPEVEALCRLGRADLQDWLRRRAVTHHKWAQALAIHLDFAAHMPLYAHKTLYWTHIRPRLKRLVSRLSRSQHAPLAKAGSERLSRGPFPPVRRQHRS
jgi:glycosyltransferase involved in cell wall biosynthesis